MLPPPVGHAGGVAPGLGLKVENPGLVGGPVSGGLAAHDEDLGVADLDHAVEAELVGEGEAVGGEADVGRVELHGVGHVGGEAAGG